jgi:hypothetical protein
LVVVVLSGWMKIVEGLVMIWRETLLGVVVGSRVVLLVWWRA